MGNEKLLDEKNIVLFDDNHDIFDDNEEPDVFQRIKSFCSSDDAADTLGIYRAVPNSRKENFICNINTGDFAPDLIKSRFGGGEFIIKAYDNKSKIRLNQRLFIEGEPIIESIKAPALFNSQQSAPAFDMPSFLNAIQESNKQMLVGLAQIMQPRGDSEVAMLEKMQLYKNLFSSGNIPAENPMDMLIKGIELAKSMEPRAAGEATGMDVLIETVKSFAPAITAVVGQSRRNTKPQIPLPAHSQSAPAIPDIPSAPEQSENEETMLFKYYVNMLVGFASQDRDPQLYADLIADNMSDEKISELLNNPNIIDDLIKINPGVSEHRTWFEAVILELKIIMGLTEPVQQNIVDAPKINLSDKNAPVGNIETNENDRQH